MGGSTSKSEHSCNSEGSTVNFPTKLGGSSSSTKGNERGDLGTAKPKYENNKDKK